MATTKINWAQKLGSRRFWALITAVAVSTVALLGGPDVLAFQITALITNVGAVAIYTLSEASVDKARAQAGTSESVGGTD